MREDKDSGAGQGRQGVFNRLSLVPRDEAYVRREYRAWEAWGRDPSGRAPDRPAERRGGKSSGEDLDVASRRAKQHSARDHVQHAIETANCGPTVTAAIEAFYPNAVIGSSLRRYLTFVLLTSPLRDEVSDEIRFGEGVQMAVAGRSFYGGWSGQDLIQALEAHLPDLTVRVGDHRAGREQRIVTDGIAAEVWSAVRDGLAAPVPRRVYVVTGKARPKDAAQAERRRLLDAAETVVAPSATAAFVRDRMNARSSNLFTRNIDLAAAHDFASSDYAPRRRPCEPESVYAARVVRSQTHVLSALASVEAQPQPIYRCSRRGRTDRVSPGHAAIPALPASVRAVLVPTFEEHDLRCSYLSVVAPLWGFDALLEQLTDQSYSPWGDLVQHAAPDHADTHFEEIKAAVKQAVYSAVFGMDRRAVLGMFTRATGHIVGPDAGRRLGSHWIIEGLLGRQAEQIAQIERAGGWPGTTPTGISATLDASVGADAKSVLSTVAMSYEQAIMRSVLDYELEHLDEVSRAGRQPDFHVAYWIHDGCGLRFTRHRERHLAQIRMRVEERAREISPAGRPIPAFLLKK